ncbi:MAG: hypothetical protein J6S67_08610 [Methanobrevibacter sp.]|nr:hypothetical protein [Methanobrevibacter sp.]
MILKLKNGDYVDAGCYGCCTWGSFSQKMIEKNDNGAWCEVILKCVDPEYDEWDHLEWELDVEEEFYELPEGKKVKNQEDVTAFLALFGADDE